MYFFFCPVICRSQLRLADTVTFSEICIGHPLRDWHHLQTVQRRAILTLSFLVNSAICSAIVLYWPWYQFLAGIAEYFANFQYCFLIPVYHLQNHISIDWHDGVCTIIITCMPPCASLPSCQTNLALRVLFPVSVPLLGNINLRFFEASILFLIIVGSPLQVSTHRDFHSPFCRAYK